ncbi:Anoctamin-3 [Podochytrium sp. JEL0797]|nr:Anoctamin-3 [Podochytrium sp. JEL0797]
MTHSEATRLIAPQYILDDVLVPWVRKDEFMGEVVSFGYIVFFSLVFPLAPLFALIGNFLEVRLGAYRLVVQSKRPFAMRAQDIGAWKGVLESLAKSGVLINALIIALSSGYFQETFLAQFGDNWPSRMGVQLAFVLVFEHTVFLVTSLVEWLVPEEPANIRNAREREKYLQRVANGEIVEVEDVQEESGQQNKGFKFFGV